jgi:hypothetical protein
MAVDVLHWVLSLSHVFFRSDIPCLSSDSPVLLTPVHLFICVVSLSCAVVFCSPVFPLLLISMYAVVLVCFSYMARFLVSPQSRLVFMPHNVLYSTH